jgi:hypothetical protein
MRSVQKPPGSQVGSHPPGPLRTERASFPALRSSMTNAPCGTQRVSFALWRTMYLTVTGGMEEPQIRQPVMLMMAIPVMPFESLLALDHLSADGAEPMLLSQDFGATWRRRVQCQLPVTVLEVRLPAGIKWIGVPPDLQMTLWFDGLLQTEDPRAGIWIGEPPRLPQGLGKVAGGDPASGFVRVAPLGPSE